MDTIPRLLLAGFLIAHAAIHIAFIAPRPQPATAGPAWPFELGRSWLLDRIDSRGAGHRTLGTALVAVTIGGLVLAGTAVLGFVPGAIGTAAVMVGAVGSLALLLLFFHPWLVLGVAIDLALISAVVLARWTPG
jgi:hypothetical protein